MKRMEIKARNQAFLDMGVRQSDFRSANAEIKSRKLIQEPTEKAIIEAEINKRKCK